MNTGSLLLALASVAALVEMPSGPASAQTAWVATSLLQFDDATGYSPNAGVVTDQVGTIYGTTTIGGTGPCFGGAGCGTVFALSPSTATASWVFTKLYDFQGSQDGSSPSAPLTVARTGAVYGYATGGTFGTVFRLLPAAAGGPWKFQILYVFSNGADGNLEAVQAPLMLRDGAVIGIASGGAQACGQIGCGSVFRLTPSANGGRWSFARLFSFQGGVSSGEPNWIVGDDEAGPLYVSTSLGHGAVVELSRTSGSAAWTERVLTRFQGGSDGRAPYNLILAPDGRTLYGLATTAAAGQVFQLSPAADPGQVWARTTIASVTVRGYGPTSLALGNTGALIGAIEGDFDFFAGAAFELVPPSTGTTWTFRELWNFNHGPDRNPLNVVTGLGGSLYGVLQGGDSTNGSLFALYPR
jgi:hypothetical protein